MPGSIRLPNCEEMEIQRYTLEREKRERERWERGRVHTRFFTGWGRQSHAWVSFPLGTSGLVCVPSLPRAFLPAETTVFGRGEHLPWNYPEIIMLGVT
jgi:hypothetical protein